MSANEPFMPVNAACLKHARGNGRPYCVLKHAVESKHSTGVRSCNAYSMDTPLYWHYPQRAKHAVGKFKDAKPIARSASINDYSTACYARAVQNIDEH